MDKINKGIAELKMFETNVAHLFGDYDEDKYILQINIINAKQELTRNLRHLTLVINELNECLHELNIKGSDTITFDEAFKSVNYVLRGLHNLYLQSYHSPKRE